MDPFALPCHPALRLDSADRDWRAVGVKTQDGVRRKATRCPECKTSWTAYERVFSADLTTVEWLQSVPFRVTAVALDDPTTPLWQDASTGSPGGEPVEAGTPPWEAVQRVAVVAPLTAGGLVFALPGDVLLERKDKWNAQDRRLALLWSARLARPVVAWHGFARLLQEPPVS